MTPVVIATVVEGHGEVPAVPVLVRRIALELFGTAVDVPRPFRLSSGKMRKSYELANAIETVAQRISGSGGVIVIRDGDDDDIECVLKLAAELREGASRTNANVEIVIAFHEFEAWLLAGADSLAGHRNVLPTATAPAEPEAHRDAKGQLSGMMSERYKETLHQARFCSLIDLAEVQARSRSFRRLVHAVEQLILS